MNAIATTNLEIGFDMLPLRPDAKGAISVYRWTQQRTE
jgi:hypothetical protein